MRKLIWGSLALTTLMAPALSQAEEGATYVGAQITQYQYKEDGGDRLKPKAISVSFGGDLTDMVALEARLGSNIKDADIPDTESGFKVDQTVGIYTKIGKAFDTPAGAVKPYGVIGVSKYTLEATGGGDTETLTTSGLSYGVGAAISPMDRLSLGLEFMRVDSDSDSTLNSLSLTANWRLGQ